MNWTEVRTYHQYWKALSVGTSKVCSHSVRQVFCFLLQSKEAIDTEVYAICPLLTAETYSYKQKKPRMRQTQNVTY